MPKVVNKQVRTIQNGERMQVVREKTFNRQAAKKKFAKLVDKVAVTDAELAAALSGIISEIDAINAKLADLTSLLPNVTANATTLSTGLQATANVVVS